MNAHVFIVDEITFDLHLKYKFAGTGARDKQATFLTQSDTNSVHFSTEKNLVGMIADVSRIRKGDKIIFYLQATQKSQGTFYGIFEAASRAFFDENDDNNYLKDELSKGLSFRVLIETDEVFENGITEHEFLDELNGKMHPYQLCWSLIYRKLKGNRGCTMITDYEYEEFYHKLKEKNRGKALSGMNFAYDARKKRIVENKTAYAYSGKRSDISIEKRMVQKSERAQAFETHLQAYVLQNVDTTLLKELVLSIPNEKFWIGNEVACGVGMQKIDILVKQESGNSVYVKVIELKDEEPAEYIVKSQIPWYLKWVSEYMIPNYVGKQIFVQPCIIAKNTADAAMIETIKNTSLQVPNTIATIMSTEYIGFEIKDGKIEFEKIL